MRIPFVTRRDFAIQTASAFGAILPLGAIAADIGLIACRRVTRARVTGRSLDRLRETVSGSSDGQAENTQTCSPKPRNALVIHASPPRTKRESSVLLLHDLQMPI